MIQTNRLFLKITSTIYILFAVIGLFVCPGVSAAETNQKTVAVLPFEMHAPESMSYMQNGLRDMLASRLAANAGASIIENAKVDGLLSEPGKMLQQQEAVELARQLGVDYVITGSLTALGGSMSIDTRVISQTDSQPQNFYASAPQENEVIGAINMLSWDIAEKVFGATNRPVQSMPLQAAPTHQEDAMAAYRTEHPEKVFRSGGGSGSPLIMSRSTVGGFTKTQNLNYSLRSMDVGDIDGDGDPDVAIASTTHLYLYRLKNNRLLEFGSTKLPARSKVHSISLGDIDRDGRAEIYVSAADDYNPHSWAYMWDGSSLQTVLDDVPWYIRVINIPGEGLVLAGQRGGQTSLLQAGIYRIILNGTKVMPEQRIPMPDYVNLFDFALGDITGDGAYEIVAINSVNRLYVVRPNGYVLWVSDEFYGGTSRYIGEDYELVGRVGLDIDSGTSSDVIGKEGSGERKYIPSRIVIMDVNNDGIQDVVLNRNHLYVKHLTNYREVKSSEIHALTWNGISLGEIWQTKKIDGYVPDLQLLPLDADKNKGKLFVGLSLARGWTGTLREGESTLLTYDIEFAQENQNDPSLKN